jgi:serine/threonine protein kinase
VNDLDSVVHGQTQPAASALSAGDEPLPGYRLLEPLGSGGFGEVWKCEVPGGLHKAIKFVYGTLDCPDGAAAPAVQELAAFQRIKAVRHPFILSQERVEVVAGRLLIVTELADRSLHDVFLECRAAGQPGIPREQLLAWLVETAEALDTMNFQHRLQHLDVKPRNLFLVANHIKVGDFGLVNSLADVAGPRQRGVTPLYASPEVLQDQISPHSDQYSLAIVYQELLTGTVPFQSKSVCQLMMQHLSADPNLDALPLADRPLVARALAKEPQQRFASCLDFIRALVSGHDQAPALSDTRVLAQHPLTRPLTQLKGASRRPGDATAEGERDSRVSRETLAGVHLAYTMTPPPAPVACAALPGYRFGDRLGQGPLGEYWLVAEKDGRERLAHFLPGALRDNGAEDQLVAHLQRRHHPALPPAEVFRSPEGQLVLVSDLPGRPLRERFQECVAQGLPGIPRDELLGYLTAAAEALDALHAEHGLAHLGLCPRNLLVKDGRVWLLEFGLVALAWLPQGRVPAEANGRYAAPEATERSRRGDVYSLALIYTELLTGLHPRPGRAGPRPARGPVRLELGLLTSADRAVIARALHAEPAQRFATCTELVEALARTGAGRALRDLARCLPPVAPVASLFGEPPPPGLCLPSREDFLKTKIAEVTGAVEVGRLAKSDYLRFADGVHEQHFRARRFATGWRLKLDTFRQQWGADLVQAEGDVCVLRIYEVGSVWRRCFGGRSGLEVYVQLEAGDATDIGLCDVVVRVHPFGRGRALQRAELGPLLLESLRACLQAEPEPPGGQRWPCRQPLRVYPVLPDMELGEPLDGWGRDLGPGGLTFLATQAPPAEFVYLHLNPSPASEALAVLGRVVRSHPADEGGYRVEAVFSAPEARS